VGHVRDGLFLSSEEGLPVGSWGSASATKALGKFLAEKMPLIALILTILV